MLQLTASPAWSRAGSSKFLSSPFNLLPSSWQSDPTLVLLRGGVPEEILLVILAGKYLGVEYINNPPNVSLALTSLNSMLIMWWGVQGWDGIFPSSEDTGKRKKRGAMKSARRHSMPHPAVVIEKRDEPAPRPKSFWFKLRQGTRNGVEPVPPGGLPDGLLPFEDPSENSLRENDRRHSARSVTSTGTGSVISLEPRSQVSDWRFSDQLSLSSHMSSSSTLTRFSGSTASTAFTAPSSGTTSKRSSRGSVLQREKRFSSVKCELNIVPRQVCSKF